MNYMEKNPPVVNEEGEEVQPVLEVNGLPVAKEKMSRVVIAIDELADLMMAAPSELRTQSADLLRWLVPQVCTLSLQPKDLPLM